MLALLFVITDGDTVENFRCYQMSMKSKFTASHCAGFCLVVDYL